MSKKKYRAFPLDFKKQVVAAIESGSKTKAAVCREHSLSPSLVARWYDQAHAGMLRDGPTAKERQLERELEQYKKKVGELTLENDLLKKLRRDSAQQKRFGGSVITGRIMGASGKDVS